MPKDYLGHKPPKPTKKEQELKQAMYALQQNFQLVVANMRAQVRGICIAAGISPEKFVESFHDVDQQGAFEAKQIMLETEMMRKAQEESAKKEVNTDNVPANAQINEEQLKELLESEGDSLND